MIRALISAAKLPVRQASSPTTVRWVLRTEVRIATELLTI